jgi:hypothetical protein
VIVKNFKIIYCKKEFSIPCKLPLLFVNVVKSSLLHQLTNGTFLLFVFICFRLGSIDKHNIHNLSCLGPLVWCTSVLSRSPLFGSLTENTAIFQLAKDTIAQMAMCLQIAINCPDSDEVVTDIFWAISKLTTTGDAKIVEHAMSFGLVKPFLTILKERIQSDHAGIFPLVRTIGNFTSELEHQTQQVIDEGIIEILPHLMESKYANVRKDAFWIASNIATGTPGQLDQLLSRTTIMDILVRHAEHDQWNIKKEALWTLSGICTGKSDKYIIPLVQANGLSPMVRALSFEIVDEEFDCELLDAIEKILKKGQKSTDHGFATLVEEYGGVEELEKYLEYPTTAPYEKAMSILKNFFELKDDDDYEEENLAPVTNTTTGTYDFGIDKTTKNDVHVQHFSFGVKSTNTDSRMSFVE